MAKNSFRIIGVKAVWPQSGEFPVADAWYYDKVESIQNALYGTDRWCYFYKGITIGDDYQTITMTPQAKQ